jgi:hypothetical protein
MPAVWRGGQPLDAAAVGVACSSAGKLDILISATQHVLREHGFGGELDLVRDRRGSTPLPV